MVPLLPVTYATAGPPCRAHMDAIRPLGKGGFGTVTMVRSRLDRRLMAIKQVGWWGGPSFR